MNDHPHSPAAVDEHVRLSIAGMSCAGCVSAVETALRGVPGVHEAAVNLAERTAEVSGTAAPTALIEAVKQAGYDAAELRGLEDEGEKHTIEEAHYRRLLRRAAVAGAIGAPLFIVDLFHMLPPLAGGGRFFWLIVGVATLGAIVYSAGHIYLAAWKAFRVHNANMDTLIALGTGAAWVYSMAVVLFPDAVPSLAQHAYFEAAAVIIALVNFGAALEMRARPHLGGDPSSHRSATQDRARDPRRRGARHPARRRGARRHRARAAGRTRAGRRRGDRG